MREGQARGTMLHVDNVANRDGRLEIFRQANAIGHCGKDGIITKFAVAKMLVKIRGGKTANLGTKGLRTLFTSHNCRGRDSRRIQGQDNLG